MATKVEQEIDLKQVSELFKNCIAAVRGRRVDNLDAKAAEWLNSLRVELMKKIETKFQALSKAADSNDPLQLPDWVVDPTRPLRILSDPCPLALAPYTKQFTDNIGAFMTDCGFNARVFAACSPPSVFVEITFPQEVTVQPVKGEGGVIEPEAIKSFSASILRITQNSKTPGSIRSISTGRKRKSDDDEDFEPYTKVKAEQAEPQKGFKLPERKKRTRLSATEAAPASKTTRSVASTSRRGRK